MIAVSGLTPHGASGLLPDDSSRVLLLLLLSNSSAEESDLDYRESH